MFKGGRFLCGDFFGEDWLFLESEDNIFCFPGKKGIFDSEDLEGGYFQQEGAFLEGEDCFFVSEVKAIFGKLGL